MGRRKLTAAGIALLAAALVWVCGSAVTTAKAEEAAKAAKATKADGKELFVSSKCNSCHSIESQKIEKKKSAAATEADAKAAGDAKGATEASAAKKTPDLSGAGDKKDAAWISKYLMKEGKLDQKLHKGMKFKGTPEELQTLSTWLGTLKTEKAEAKE